MYVYCFEVEISTIKSKMKYTAFRATSCSKAARLKNTTVKKIPIEKRNRFLWTDLKIVLNYLNNNDTNFGVYIAHRINEIRQSTNPNNLRYIKTE